MRKHFFNTQLTSLHKKHDKKIRYGDCTSYTFKKLMNNN